MKLIKFIFIFISIFFTKANNAQQVAYSVANAHSHNDYENAIPFYTAYDQNFGSIEADIFYYNDTLWVGHVFGDIKKKRTLEDLYLHPLKEKLKTNNNFPFADSTKELQLLIDVKTDPQITLKKLITVLNSYPEITNTPKIKIVITGNRPLPKYFDQYPAYMYFDGNLNTSYSNETLKRIGLFSADFGAYSNWNGKGILVKATQKQLDSIIATIHSLHKKIRFYGTPDFLNAWQQFINMKIDFINTDHIVELARYLNNWNKNNISLQSVQKSYTPLYKNDGIDSAVKKIILLIGDGCSLPQWYAGYTANGGQLSIFQLKHIGFSKTSSSNNYVTDSAPGASALASGEKIENRHIGLNPKGDTIPLITDYLASKNFNIGILTSGDLTDATPAAFYAHANDRDSALEIIQQLNNSAVNILAGASNEKINSIGILQKKTSYALNQKALEKIIPKYKIDTNINVIEPSGFGNLLILDKKAGLSIQEGRGDWLSNTFEKMITRFDNSPKDLFFIMGEAAQIDYGGHANNIEYVVKEVLDFDRLITKAIEYADHHKGTLVIVTGDHETGGLTLHDGDYQKQKISVQFATNDHTGIPVPVFAYGYRSFLFDGVYENTAIFQKMKQAVK